MFNGREICSIRRLNEMGQICINSTKTNNIIVLCFYASFIFMLYLLSHFNFLGCSGILFANWFDIAAYAHKAMICFAPRIV